MVIYQQSINWQLTNGKNFNWQMTFVPPPPSSRPSGIPEVTGLNLILSWHNQTPKSYEPVQDICPFDYLGLN